jgi:hypothetical protein
VLLAIMALGPENWQPRTGFGWQFDHFFGYFVITTFICLAWPRQLWLGQPSRWPQLTSLNSTFEYFPPKQARLAMGFLELVKRIRRSRARHSSVPDDVNAFSGTAVQTGLDRRL